MKLVIFGATGGTGIPLVQQALDDGHEVVAFVRSPSKLTVKHDHLSVVEGDAMNASDVKNAITADVDAVLSALGPTNDSPSDMMPKAAQNIVDAMKAAGVDRLIFMTGAGVSAPQDQPGLFNHLIKFALKTFAADVLKQSEKAVDIVRTSDLGWTVVRAPRLTDGDHTGDYRVGWVGVNTGAMLSRPNAADFMLSQLKSDEYIELAPVISN